MTTEIVAEVLNQRPSNARAHLDCRLPDASPKEKFMDTKVFLFLILATSLETVGDAFVRMGISQTAWPLRGGLFLAGTALLFGYGFCLNLPAVEFGRIVGLYVATLFIVWQITNFVMFGSLPETPVWLGGMLIVIGGLIVTFWK